MDWEVTSKNLVSILIFHLLNIMKSENMSRELKVTQYFIPMF